MLRPQQTGREEFLESPSKFDVEYGVDERVEEAVDVPEPHEEREEDGVDLADQVLLEKVVSDADGVDDVDGEEGDPTKEEHA